MSGYYWLNATVLFVAAVLCCEMWYRRLEATLTAKLKLDEAKTDALDRICGRLEAIQQELAESNAMMADDGEPGDYDEDEWELN